MYPSHHQHHVVIVALPRVLAFKHFQIKKPTPRSGNIAIARVSNARIVLDRRHTHHRTCPITIGPAPRIIIFLISVRFWLFVARSHARKTSLSPDDAVVAPVVVARRARDADAIVAIVVLVVLVVVVLRVDIARGAPRTPCAGPIVVPAAARMATENARVVECGRTTTGRARKSCGSGYGNTYIYSNNTSIVLV